jgi:membrane carboxypeptidase/penicillin-binding protein PbpC
VYTLRAKRLGEDIITLRATTGAAVRDVYWFVGRSFIGKSPPGGSLSWRPEAPGAFTVRAVDDQGQADARLIELAVVP